MDDGAPVYEPVQAGGRKERRAAALVGVLVLVLIGLAIVKPWVSLDDSAPPTTVAQADVSSPVVSPASPVPASPSAASAGPATTSAAPTGAPAGPSAVRTIAARPLPVSFTTSPPPTSATWTGLDWRRLAPEDPLSLVTSVVPWRRGYLAVGSQTAPPATPVWTSGEGSRWTALPFNTSATFWPGMLVLGVAARDADLVAVTETVQYCAGPCPLVFELPVVSWTSTDGRRWTPHMLPQGWLASPEGRAPLVAEGPAGLVVASGGPSARLATSADGAAWHLLPADRFPARFALDDLRGTATGYVAVGRWTTPDGGGDAAALWSRDGRTWPASPVLLSAPSAATDGPRSVLMSLAVGRDGIIAIGGDVLRPGGVTWWWSRDGRRWTTLPDFPPLGPTPCIDVGCGGQPDGTLVADGRGMLALRGGADTSAWISTDGLAWRQLTMTGDLPGAQATLASLLPGGVLLSDGATTWLGEAQGPTR